MNMVKDTKKFFVILSYVAMVGISSYFFAIGSILYFCIILMVGFFSFLLLYLYNTRVKIKVKDLFLFLWETTIVFAFLGSSIGYGNIFAYRIFLFVYIFLFLIIVRKFSSQIIKARTIKKTLIFFIIWLTYSIITIVWANSKVDVLRYTYFLLSAFLLIYFSICNFRSMRDFKKVSLIILSIYILFCIVGLVEVFTGWHLPISAANMYRSSEKGTPTSFFVNPNDFASFLTIYLPIIFIAYTLFKNKLIKFAIILISLCSVFLIVKTDSRANLLGILLFMIIYVALVNSKQKMKVFVATGIVIVLIITMSPVNIVNIVSDAVSSLKSMNTDYSYGSMGIRKNLIKNGILMLKDTMFLGVGAGNVEANMSKYSAINYTVGITNMHNFWIEILACYGVFIFIYFIYIFSNIFMTLVVMYRRVSNKEDQSIIRLLLVSMIVFCISVVSSSSLLSFRPVWIFFGYILSYINIFMLKKEANDESTSTLTYVSK